jgi:hypothetical protein
MSMYNSQDFQDKWLNDACLIINPIVKEAKYAHRLSIKVDKLPFVPNT